MGLILVCSILIGSGWVGKGGNIVWKYRIKDIIFAFMWIDQYLLRKATLEKKMAFVYSLSYDGKVFYIGCAMDLYVRYKQHIKVGKSKTQTSLFIKQILDNNELPELNIIDRLLYNEAILLESKRIKYFSLSG